MPDQFISAPYPYNVKTGGIELPPSVELRLRALAGQGYKLAALRQVVDLTGAPITTAREFIENLLQPEQQAEETNLSSLQDLQSES